MIITSVENDCFQKGKKSRKKGILVEINDTAQEVRGFGGCFNELGKIALDSLNSDDAKSIMTELFSKNGCNFTFCRVGIGANDFSVGYYSCCDSKDDYELKTFSIEREKEKLIPYIKEALNINPNIDFFASPWTPPYWMKTSQGYAGGTIISEPKIYKTYARYIKKYVLAIKHLASYLGQTQSFTIEVFLPVNF